MLNIELLYNFYGFNKKLFLLINSATNVSIIPYFLQLFSWVCFISNGVIYYLILCVYCYIKIKQTTNFKERENQFWTYYYKLANIGIIYATFVFTYVALKYYAHAPRPFCSLKPSEFSTICKVDITDCFSSFPSAHTGLAVIIVYVIWPYINNLGRTLACIFVLLVGISRITLAMHYPADTIYSLFITGLIVLISNILYKMLYHNIIKLVGSLSMKLFRIIP